MSKQMKIEKVAQEWLNKIKLRLKQSSFGNYYGITYNHILPYFENCYIAVITRETVEKFIDYKLKDLSVKTVHDIASKLIQMLKFAERQCYIKDFNYDIDLPTLQKKELKLLNYTDEQRLNAYLKKNLTFENFGIILAKSIGLRIGELCALQWSDFNLEKGTVNITKTLQRVKNHDVNAPTKTKIVITAPKSQKSVREIPLPDTLMPIVKKLYNRSNPDTYILTGTIKYSEPRNVQKKFKKLLNLLGIININFHSLRHLFATRAVESGFDIKSLSEILGHSTVKFTLDRYVHSSFELKRENMNKMAGCF
jgi:integrase